MGNETSTLDLSHITNTENAKSSDETFYINLKCLKQPAYTGEKEYMTTQLKISAHNYSFKTKKLSKTPILTWIPESRMRDFEVLEPYTKNEIKLKQGQVIGVIIIEPLNVYIKLIWTNQIDPIVYATWNKSEQNLKVLHGDLTLGLEVLYMVSKDKYYILNETKKEEKIKPAKIFVPGLENLSTPQDY